MGTVVPAGSCDACMGVASRRSRVRQRIIERLGSRSRRQCSLSPSPLSPQAARRCRHLALFRARFTASLVSSDSMTRTLLD